MNIENFMQFVENSPTCFQVIDNLKSILLENNFIEIDDDTKLICGNSYFKIRNGSTIVAFRIPKTFNAFRITMSHSDSPCYKLKSNPTYLKNGYTMLNVAKYGGMIDSTFFDRPLTIAGRVSYIENDRVKSKNINFNRPMGQIINMPIHFNRAINDGHKYQTSKDMQPILGIGEINLLDMIQKEFDIPNITAHDLFMCSYTKPYLWGEFITSPRLDDLECAYTSIRALIDTPQTNQIAMAVVFNNEEVGSLSYMGAQSDFLTMVFTKVITDLGKDKMWLYNALEKSLSISADNAHALHPNYSEKYDLQNSTMINKGIVIKFSPTQKYTTDSITATKFIQLCQKSGVNYQCFENHSDILGGSTLGNLSNSQFSIPTVDIGLPQLAMHSSCETAGRYDIIDLYKVLKTHFNEK